MTFYSLDFSNMAEFDALAQSVQAKLNCKACLISLVQDDALIALGHSASDTPKGLRSIPARDTVCAHTVRGGVFLRLADIQSDPVLRNIPTVAAMGIGAYMGVPLRVNGEVVGALCALSSEARLWTQAEAQYIEAVGDLAESKIERHTLRYEHTALSDALAETDAILSVLAESQLCAVTLQNAYGDLVFANAAMRTELGLSDGDILALPELVRSLVEAGKTDARVQTRCREGPPVRLRVRVSPTKSDLIMAEWELLNS